MAILYALCKFQVHLWYRPSTYCNSSNYRTSLFGVGLNSSTMTHARWGRQGSPNNNQVKSFAWSTKALRRFPSYLCDIGATGLSDHAIETTTGVLRLQATRRTSRALAESSDTVGVRNDPGGSPAQSQHNLMMHNTR